MALGELYAALGPVSLETGRSAGSVSLQCVGLDVFVYGLSLMINFPPRLYFCAGAGNWDCLVLAGVRDCRASRSSLR